MLNDQMQLAPYAVTVAASRGRRFTESSSASRSDFQRDRDRIIHSTAFRRLEYKTQVFVNHEGDLFRTRLTHSLEVAQIARSVARDMRLNEDLVEAISLAHDLGHTPFGHAGQQALNDCMNEYGGFEHNLQSLRVVDLLEERYGAFDGLNLMFETREGILKHCSLAAARKLGEVGDRFVQSRRPSLEAQIVNIADEIAYNNHDIDDGLRSGLLTNAQLDEVNMYSRHRRQVQLTFPSINERRATHETVRRMINEMIIDLFQTSKDRILQVSPENLDDIHQAPLLISFSESMQMEVISLRQFLHENLYRHHQVNRMTSKARRVIAELFCAFIEEPILLPPDYLLRDGTIAEQARKVADYIAGMTDRYAIREHQRLYSVSDM